MVRDLAKNLPDDPSKRLGVKALEPEMATIDDAYDDDEFN